MLFPSLSFSLSVCVLSRKPYQTKNREEFLLRIYMRKMPSLFSLRLVRMLVTIVLFGVTRATGDKCIEQCTCKWKSGKRTVECKDRSLTGIPESIDPETQVLDASGNKIGHLPKKIFTRVHLTNLQRLYLRECRIDRIDDEAFNGLTNLVELDLSNNYLKTVPRASLSKTPFLRDLILANNPIGRVRTDDFQTVGSLVKLDLSYGKLLEIEAKGFHGLNLLESLKLNNNRLSTFHPGTFEPLKKLTSIELHDNPWICDCHLREMKMWLVKHNHPTLVAPICHGPNQSVDRAFQELAIDDFACRPVLLIASHYAEATIGENASIVCHVSAVPPATVKWYWNGRLLANHSAFSSYQKILIYEEGQFKKRSTLVLTNAQESDSSEFYCAAENRAGSVEANFTLHVSLRTAGMSTLGSGQIAGISAALLVLILFILLIILVLFVRLRRMPLKEVKPNVPTDNDSQNLTNENNRGDSTTTTTTTTTTSTTATTTTLTTTTNTLSSSSRRKREEVEMTGSFALEMKPPPGSLNLSYVERPQTGNIVRKDHHYRTINRAEDHRQPRYTSTLGGTSGGCFSSTTSLMPIDNPDLIRDTRRGSAEDVTPYGSNTVDYSRLELEDPSKILYSSCMWEARDSCGTSVPTAYPVKESIGSGVAAIGVGEQFPTGAKQMRVWQKGVPVLPPVSALKRVLGSTRSSPDEGYQEGTGTDV